jgi:hypothetical protein
MKPRSHVGLVLVVLLAISQALFAQTSNNVTLLGNFGKGEGESKACYAAGSLVFYGLGNKVQIASFSNPAAPVKIGSVILSDVVEALVRTSINSTQYVVASGGSKMWLINVQNPTTPSLVSTTDVAPGTTCEGIATSGSYAYVAAGSAGLRIYSIANPAVPTFVASIDTLAYSECVAIAAPYAFVAGGSGKSHIVDITDPAHPVYAGGIYRTGYHQAINVRGSYAYVCNYGYPLSSTYGLAVFDITNKAAATYLTTVPLDRSASVVFDGNYGYCAAGDSGMVILNMTTPGAPTVAGKMTTAGRAAWVTFGAISINNVSTGHVFVSNRLPAPGISAINVAVPATPTTSAFLGALASATGSAFTPYYANGNVYVAYGTAGLRIFDVATPSQPTVLATLPLGGESRNVVVKGNYAYVAAYDSGVYYADVTNPASPVRLGQINTSRARGIALGGNYVYVATRDSGLVILDVTTPASPTWLTNVRGLDIENVAASGNLVALSTWSELRLFDVTNPATPVTKGVTPTFTVGNEGFGFSGNYIYAPDGDTLKIFNVTNPLVPAQVSKIYTGGYGYTAALSETYCYVASEATGVRVIDVTNPATPTEAGFYDGVPQSRGITSANGYIYAAEKLDGLSVYRNTLVTSVAGGGSMPGQFALMQNYPNPFNPTTNIQIELAEAAFVRLEVFDLIGQRVAVVLAKQMPAGAYSVPFNASSLASGLYLYRMQANGFSSVRKMMVLK